MKSPTATLLFFLLSASGFELQRVKTALEDSGIPCDNISQKHSYSAEAVTGYDTGEYDLLVPYSAYQSAYDTCVGIGAINEGEAQILEDDGSAPVNEGVKSVEEQFDEMSGGKRTAIRILSAILFFIIFALVIFGTDAVMNLIKNIFI
ncbi:MAG: hypothetical protein LUF33_08935 [Clostridiales bacterium]|nr:hypothetical protein [Clostridiales bacterium]